MKLSIVYYSKTGRTEQMVRPIQDGIAKFDAGIEVRAFRLEELDQAHPENLAYVNDSTGVVFGTPVYCASECWQLKQWIDTAGVKLPGKLVGCYATCQYAVGGADVAIQNVLIQMIVKGAMAYSGGAANGQPYIHLGPISYNGHEAADCALFEVYGTRFAAQASRLCL